MLDLESVRLFVLAVEYGNLTRAAEAAGTVQPVVSQRIKALEARLGRKLLDRSPRFVRLTDAGGLFLNHARTLLAAHDAALMDEGVEIPSVTLGISDHVLGTSLHEVLRSLRFGLPARTRLTVRLGLSHEMRELFDRREVDLAIIRRDGGGGDGEVLGEDGLDWYGDASEPSRGDALPLVLLPSPCGVRATAISAVEKSGLHWREAFTGGSCLALAAAVDAGAGVAPLGRLTAMGLTPFRKRDALPELPKSRIVMLARTPEAHHSRAANALAAGVRKLLRA
ncbi:LysR family transcriptional regulator [Aliidongia dinghuensis]|uniref:LysR family transcriptional regulator n=2 Tax=Aliidongia dinghuensis TaxID=1867774 RepID=A0A8J2YRJ1_9PROT|nr:LysR family transcriptional regulator [Aliidongia dinghuensis]